MDGGVGNESEGEDGRVCVRYEHELEGLIALLVDVVVLCSATDV